MVACEKQDQKLKITNKIFFVSITCVNFKQIVGLVAHIHWLIQLDHWSQPL